MEQNAQSNKLYYNVNRVGEERNKSKRWKGFYVASWIFKRVDGNISQLSFQEQVVLIKSVHFSLVFGRFLFQCEDDVLRVGYFLTDWVAHDCSGQVGKVQQEKPHVAPWAEEKPEQKHNDKHFDATREYQNRVKRV